jgi:hypothetical protein
VTVATADNSSPPTAGRPARGTKPPPDVAKAPATGAPVQAVELHSTDAEAERTTVRRIIEDTRATLAAMTPIVLITHDPTCCKTCRRGAGRQLEEVIC